MLENLTIIQSTDIDDIVKKLKDIIPGSMGAHFTNGTYMLEAKKILPTTFAFFDYLQEELSLPMVIAINSDKSLRALGKQGFESQNNRAQAVANPLAERFPNQSVIVVFYDDETPYNLYLNLAKHDLTKTLHKWGYGTSPQAPKIEGAEFFETVYASPLPNDQKPICYNETAKQDEKNPQVIKVLDLREGAQKIAKEFDQSQTATTFFQGTELAQRLSDNSLNL